MKSDPLLNPNDTAFHGAALIDSMQKISSEIVKENLLKIIIQVLVELSTAHRVVFFSVRDGRLYLEAENFPGTNTCRIRNSLSVIMLSNDEREAYSLPVIEEVIRAREPMYMDGKEEPPSGLSKAETLCIPVIHDWGLSGVLYFEFHATGRLSNDLLEALFSIARQISISFRNA